MIIQNAVRILEGDGNTFLISSHTHDFRTHTFEDGTYIAVDGGPDYLRRVGCLDQKGVKYVDWSIDESTPFKTVKERLLWGTLGKDGKGPLKYVILKDCETEHLQSILTYQYPPNKPLNPLHKMVIQDILDDRGVA
jgi:hypothetical protein